MEDKNAGLGNRCLTELKPYGLKSELTKRKKKEKEKEKRHNYSTSRGLSSTPIYLLLRVALISGDGSVLAEDAGNVEEGDPRMAPTRRGGEEEREWESVLTPPRRIGTAQALHPVFRASSTSMCTRAEPPPHFFWLAVRW